ncbi:hypothetical protein [Lyngbya sp. CCY1209]|nr:hypothetical protein [Lyngbya sp. CCY1209]
MSILAELFPTPTGFLRAGSTPAGRRRRANAPGGSADIDDNGRD